VLFRKTNVALLALCMSACVAVGCGPDDENASDNNKTTADMGTTTADMPGTTADMPGTTTDMPGTTTDMPGTTTDMPGTTTDMPGTTTDMPGTTDMPVGDDMTTPDMPEDMDVPGVCGDGEVTGNETCDGDCISSPTECDDNDACTINAVQGSAAQCNSVCDFSQPVTMCDGGASDGCCPAGCDGSNDADCDPVVPMESQAGIACAMDTDCGMDGFCVTPGIDATFVGGYCITVLGCADNTSCGGDNICAPVFQDGSTGCLDGCAADADCRTGYTCQGDPNDPNAPGACFPEPAPITGVTGIACASDMECDDAEVCIGSDSGFAGGYCTRACQVDTECPTGSACHINDTDNNSGLCLDNCMLTTDCRTPNYECFAPFPLSTVDACFPVASGSGLVGDVCDSVLDCAGGQTGLCITEAQGFNAGYCSVQCVVDADCATGHCSAQFGVCLDSCTMDSECRTPGYLCDDADADQVLECFPGSTGTGALGTACTDTSECAGRLDAFCLAEADNSAFSGGYCLTSGCIVDADCAAGGVCLEQQGGDNLCVDGCATDADCRSAEGYTCQPLVQNGPNVACFPAP
jgi:hypothetical protein